MEHDPLIAMLNRLKLTAIRDQLDSLVDEAARRELTIREALSLFCEREIARKDERRIEMGIGLARFPFVRDLDSFDFAAQPSIDKKQIREIDRVLQAQRLKAAAGEDESRDVTAVNVAAHRLENLIHDRRLVLGAQGSGKAAG